MSLENGKRIKDIELTGYKENLPKNFASNIMLSFDLVSMNFYLHFTFKDKALKIKAFKSFEENKPENLNSIQLLKDKSFIEKKSIGMDLGQTETGTLSDGKVIGFGQGKILNKITQKETVVLKKIQAFSLPNYFGIEPNNKGKRNTTNNCFNHNQDKGNINLNFRLFQQKSHKQIEQFLPS